MTDDRGAFPTGPRFPPAKAEPLTRSERVAATTDLREGENAVLGHESFRLGPVVVEPRLNRLIRNGHAIQLEIKAMDVLLSLARRAGDVVTRQEIVDEVWATEYISDNTLTHAISELRNALADDAKTPRFVETIHRRGYRLITPVSPLGPGALTADTIEQFPAADERESADLHPYPGLAPFTEDDAAVFFGREAEISRVWRKLSTRRLVALIGSSGAGKSSLLRAGIVAQAPQGWRALVCQPGEYPFRGVARAMAPDLADDPDDLQRVMSFDDQEIIVSVAGRWRQRWHHALLAVDQFEELFTLCPESVQRGYVELLRQLVDVSGIHVVLVMRDDFLIECNRFPQLEPIFDSLTPIGPPTADGLRRALVEPAARHGYSFEEPSLVDRMVGEVEQERGALPLVAFAVSCLWERRDREQRMLTREAYDAIGGVGGALAQHAESTVERIGVERIAIIRELFRNLVTAEGTRAVREWGELLSVFESTEPGSHKPQKGVPAAKTRRDVVAASFQLASACDAAEEVLRELIDARLLTSYEVREDEHEPTRHVEIIHESLLANWPRLVRWQTQDADAAQLRDQLRQAAKTWDEHDRTDDMLWTGSAYRQYSVWRESYPGGLTEVEEAFATAMMSHANRRRRTRRIAVTAIIVTLALGLAVVGTFWQRSVRETRRAEAQKLIALGQLELERNPSAAIAHAISSLQLADSTESRLMALQALWKGPTALVVNEDDVYPPKFSADGRWLVHSVVGPSSEIRIIRDDGSTVVLEHAHQTQRIGVDIGPGPGVILTWDMHRVPSPHRFALWSAPEGRLLTEVRYDRAVFFRRWSWNDRGVLLAIEEDEKVSIDAVSFDGSRERLGALPSHLPNPQFWYRHNTMDSRTGRWFGAVVDQELLVVEIGEHGLSEPRRLGRHEGRIARVVFDPFGRYVATASHEGEITLWDPTGATPPAILEGPSGVPDLGVSKDGRFLTAGVVENEHTKVWIWSVAVDEPRLLRSFDLGEEAPATFWGLGTARGCLARVGQDKKIRVWPFSAPADAEPLVAGRNENGQLWKPVFDHTGRWLATGGGTGLTLYPLTRPYASVMRHDVRVVSKVAFGPDGRWLASCGLLGFVKVWPLEGGVPPPGRTAYGVRVGDESGGPVDIAVSRKDGRILVGTYRGDDVLISFDGRPRNVLKGFREQTLGLAFSVDGRLAAGAGGAYAEDENVIRIWELESGTERAVLVPETNYHRGTLQFTQDNHLLSSGTEGLRRWDLETGKSETLYDGMVGEFSASVNGRRTLLVQVVDAESGGRATQAMLLDLEAGIATALETHGDRVSSVALDERGHIVVTGDLDGVVRVGSATGDEPHLLFGHEGAVRTVAIDPLGRWIASGGGDGTVRLWPMPDLSKPPLHTLPREELIAKLKTLTNLRVVRDPTSATGWKLTHDPFPGWETVPTW